MVNKALPIASGCAFGEHVGVSAKKYEVDTVSLFEIIHFYVLLVCQITRKKIHSTGRRVAPLFLSGTKEATKNKENYY